MKLAWIPLVIVVLVSDAPGADEPAISKTPAVQQTSDASTTAAEAKAGAPESRSKLVIVGDGGATTDADREKVKKLVSEGVLMQIDRPGFVPSRAAEIMFQPKVAASGAVDLPRSGGGFFGGPGLPEEVSTTPINPKWEDALRALSKQGLDTEVQIRFFSLADSYHSMSFQFGLDAQVVVPVDSSHTLADAIKLTCESVGLAIDTKQNHPFFGTISIPRGKELYPVYANESGSPTAILKGNDDLVDVRLMLEEGNVLRGALGSAPTVVAQAPTYIIQNAPQAAGGRRVVGILVSPDDARLLRAAEREGRLEAVRRDPGDKTTQVSQDLRQSLAGAESGAPDPAVAGSEASPSKSSGQFKVFRLQHANADAMATLLTQIVRAEGFIAVPDERTNSVLVTSQDPGALETTEALLEKLDEAGPAASARKDRSRTLDMTMRMESDMGPGMSGRPDPRPSAELEKTSGDLEAAAAIEARRVREFIGKRPPGLSDKDFEREEAAFRKRLSGAVRQSFHARQALLSAELAALQAKIAATRQSLELRERVEDEIVARRVADLLNPELTWDVEQISQPAGMLRRTSTVDPASAVAEAAGESAPSSTPPSASGQSPRGAGRSASGGGSGGSFYGARQRQPRTLEIVGVSPVRVTSIFGELGIEASFSGSRSGNFTAKFQSTDEEFRQVEAALEREQSIADENARTKMLNDLTGLWETRAAGDMMGGLGGYGSVDPLAGFGGEAPGIDGSAPMRLAISGDVAALYERNERRRLWSVTVPRPGDVHFTALDDPPGWRGVLDDQGWLTLVSTGEEGAKIERYRRAVPVVPPEWANEMQAARAKRIASVSPPEAAAAIPLPDSGLFADLRGLWASRSRFGGMGMAPAMELGFAADGTSPTGFLAIHGDRAGLYEGNDRKRLWTITIEQSDAPQSRLSFIADDGQPGMQGSYSAKSGELTLVSAGPEGPQIEYYRRAISVVPPEWAGDLEKADQSPQGAAASKAARPSGSTTHPGGANRNTELLRGMAGGELIPRSGSGFAGAMAGESGSFVRERAVGARKPSDYLQLIQPYRDVLAERDRMASSLGEGHPDFVKKRAEFERAARAIDVLKQEYEAELESAAAELKLKQAELVAATASLERAQKLSQKGALAKAQLQKDELATEMAEAKLEAAESKLKLLESAKEGLFPSASPAPAAPTPAAPGPLFPSPAFKGPL